MSSIYWFIFNLLELQTSNRLHALSRSQQARRRESSVETLRCPFFAEPWWHCVLSGGTQRRAMPRHQVEEIKILNISFPRVECEPTIKKFSRKLLRSLLSFDFNKIVPH